MRDDFNIFAAPIEGETQKKNRPATLTFRLTQEERALLEREAAGIALAAYVRGKVFGDDAEPRRTRGKFPVKDHEALGRVLARLGRSDLAHAIGGLLLAFEERRMQLDDEQEEMLRSINNDILFMRLELMKALGNRSLSNSNALGD